MNGPVDPLDALRESVVPLAPDPGFAAALRARLERAVLDPRGVTMTTESVTPTGTSVTSVTENIPTIPPAEGDVVYSSLWVGDIDRAAEFYRAVLGWAPGPGRESGSREVPGMTPPMGMYGGNADATLFLVHAVDDVRAATERVRAAGGEAEEPTERPYGLAADCTDNQGMRLTLLEVPRAARSAPTASGPGHLLYLTVGVPDSGAFREFYGSVFGWSFRAGRAEDGWSIEGMRPMAGMHGGAERSSVVPMYAVPDVAEAVARVRAAGGTSTDPVQQPYGLTADCADDQGAAFYLGQV